MKHSVALIFVIAMMAGSISCKAQSDNSKGSSRDAASKVEVYYFHFTRRCETCKAVEEETKKALENLYSEQEKKNEITFTAVNLDEENSKTVAEKCKATGQSLLIISGDKRIDLTSQGFMYARTNPEKLKQIIRENIDPLL